MRDSGNRSAADIAPIGVAAQPALGARPAAVVKVLCVAHLGAALAWLDVAHNWGIALGIGIMALIEEVVFRRWLPDWLSPPPGDHSCRACVGPAVCLGALALVGRAGLFDLRVRHVVGP
jgi:hypothetical protein